MLIEITFNNLSELKDFTEMVAVSDTDAILSQDCVAAPAPEAVQAAAGEAPTTPTAQAPVALAAQAPAAPVVQAPATAPVPGPTAPVQPAVGQVPTSAPAYTLDELARAAMALMDTGRQPDLQALLAQFGVETLPMLPKNQYGAFAMALRGMGAQI